MLRSNFERINLFENVANYIKKSISYCLNVILFYYLKFKRKRVKLKL